jgi:hypothetical protein
MAVEEKFRLSGEIPRTESPGLPTVEKPSNLHHQLLSTQQYMSREFNSAAFTLPLSHAWHRDSNLVFKKLQFLDCIKFQRHFFNKWIIDKRRFGTTLLAIHPDFLN